MNYSCLPMIYFKAIVLDRTLSLFDWLEIASGLPLDGTEIHWRMLPTAPGDIDQLRDALHACRLRVSQVTCAPDFTHPEATMRAAEIARTRKTSRSLPVWPASSRQPIPLRDPLETSQDVDDPE